VSSIYTLRQASQRSWRIGQSSNVNVKESADAVWKRLVEKQAEVFGVRAVETSPSEMEAEPPERDVPEAIIPPPAPIPAMVTQLLMFGSSLENLPKRKTSRRRTAATTSSSQLGLF
jgi:hypothetical protein